MVFVSFSDLQSSVPVVWHHISSSGFVERSYTYSCTSNRDRRDIYFGYYDDARYAGHDNNEIIKIKFLQHVSVLAV